MVSWIQQRYTCVEEDAVQIDVATMLPLLWVSIAVYALAVVVRIMTVVYERQRARTNTWCMSGCIANTINNGTVGTFYLSFGGE
jgi:hypothetical protein